MSQTSNFTMFANPFQAWTNLVLTSTQMLMTSAQVIGQRTSRMMLAGATPDVRDQRELTMMSEEKTAAAVESVQAMAQGMFTLSQQLAVMTGKQMLASMPLMMSLATSITPQQSAARQTNLARAGLANAAQTQSRIAESIPRIAAKSLKPIHAKATANRKRLSKHAATRRSAH
jgi:hypothetical protein